MRAKILAAGALATVLTLGALGGGAALASGGNDDNVTSGSVQAPEREFENEAREDMNLGQRAGLNASDAAEAALASQPGKVTKVELDDEEGYVVYEVEIIDNNGVEHDLKVDAGNGDILKSETDNDNDDNDANDADDRDDDDRDDGHDDDADDDRDDD